MILTLMSLILSGLGVVAYVRNKQAEFKAQAGQAEASVLESLSRAANLAITENMSEIQLGRNIVKTVGADTVSVVPSPVGGQPVWQVSPIELRRMGYLPEGWNTTTSSLNHAPYSISFRRTPAGCLPANCNIEGAVVLEGPISDPSTGHSDGAVIGPILTKLGVDAAVSLVMTPAQLTGNGPGGSWSMPNPLAGNPAGVVAVRIGTTASAYAPFVRLGDLRDPQLAGNLTAQGDLSIGGRSAFRANVSLNNAELNLNNTAGTNCLSLLPNGTLSIKCSGVFNTLTGTFKEGLNVGNLSITSSAPDTLMVQAGDFFIRSATGPGYVRAGADGTLQASGGITAGDTMVAPDLQLNAPVTEGSSCAPSTLASLLSGGLAICNNNGLYTALLRFGSPGSACATTGSMALDTNTSESLLCRNGAWVAVNAMVSNFVMMGSHQVLDSSSVAMPPCRNATASYPLLFILPANDAGNGASGFYRGAETNPSGVRASNGSGYDIGGSWTVRLPAVDPSSGASASNALALTYCYYP